MIQNSNKNVIPSRAEAFGEGGRGIPWRERHITVGIPRQARDDTHSFLQIKFCDRDAC